MAERSSTVWMVNRRTGPDGVKGSLSLEDASVVFHPDSGGEPTHYPLSSVRRAKRVIGSPVLELHLDEGSDQPIVGFYFVRPPSLEASEGPRLFKRRYARRVAVSKLRQWNVVKRDEVAEWVDAIRQTRGG